MAPEEFRQLLIEARNGANLRVSELFTEADGGIDEVELDKARAVWHAAEFALGMLDPHYVPKRAALLDAKRLLEANPDPTDTAAWN